MKNSAFTEAYEIRKCFDVTSQDHIVKPFEVVILFDKMVITLNKYDFKNAFLLMSKLKKIKLISNEKIIRKHHPNC